jgi:nitrogen fixation protein FixH
MSKFNWGHGVTIAVSLFIIFTSSFVYFTTTVDVDLVREDYYDAEIRFDEIKEKKNNSIADKQFFSVGRMEQGFTVNYSDSTKIDLLTGQLHMYYPADEKHDLLIDMKELSENKFFLPLTKTGKWILKFDWSVNNKSYYQEIPVFLEYK